ncbi:MAG: hypothetical protein M1814_006692 [Vezdaea aestivalis]|nr:MAG: hypothetical protein M1814_006692 [Vezdaea aestivalis]
MLSVGGGSRGRSKSPGRERGRSRSRSAVRAPTPPGGATAYQESGASFQMPSASYAQPGQFAHRDGQTAQYANPESYQARPTEGTRHLSMTGSANFSIGGSGAQYAQPNQAQYAAPQQPSYGQPQYKPSSQHNSVSGPSAGGHYAPEGSYSYHQPDQRISYKYKQDPPPQVIDAVPHRPHGASFGGASPGLLPQQMGGLSIGGPGPMPGAFGGAPPSPLLEAYQGTYQSISPMPSAMILASHAYDDLEDLSPLSESDDSDRYSGHGKHRKSKRGWNVEKDCIALANALKDKRKIDPDPLIEILPRLSNSQIVHLREQYKKYATKGGQGINISKQTKAYLPDGPFNKAVYTTTLGRWESEAYWANFWYQGGHSKNELLIESLMGRPNEEILAIKKAFTDKRYHDDIDECMEKELKGNKFKKCVQLALKAERQPEPAQAHPSLLRADVETLYRAVNAKEGGESAIISIVICRSDAHLRECLRVYEQNYKQGFTRKMLEKSNNLVGEALTHILNGALNKAMRDAMLLNQCLDGKHALSSAKEKEAAKLDLLVSRLVRLHWDRQHMERVKAEYARKYHKQLVQAVGDATKGDVGAYLVELCARR